MNWIRRHKIVSGLLALIALIIVIVAASTGGSKHPAARSTPRATHSASVAAAAPSATDDPLEAVYQNVCQLLGAGGTATDIASLTDQTLKDDGITGYTGQQIVQTAEKQDCPQYLAKPSQTAPAMTAAEQQAVAAAQGYLDLGTGFSKEGLLKQLTSSYGNGFSEKDAEFAVSYLKPDWNAQAVEAAKGYMNLNTGFSRASLIQQLTSSYGSGFTEAQAEYAADKVGL